MQAFLFAANLMSVATYFTDNLLRLRILTAGAAACLAIYFSSLPQPMTTVVAWNLFFLLLNMVHLGRLLLARRRGLRLSAA